MPYWFLDYLDSMIAITAVLIAVVNFIYFRRLSSVAIGAVGFMLVQALSVLITVPIREVLPQYYPDLARLAFYFSFAFIDLIAIVIIYRLHRQLSLSFSSAAKMTVGALQFLAALQVLRYLDRTIELNLLAVFYQYSVPIVNIAIILTLCFSTVVMFVNQKSMVGVKGD
jgi:hypothetical protein